MSLRRAMVVTEHSTEALASLNLAIQLFRLITRVDKLIRQPLMIPFSVIMSDEFTNSISQRPLAKEDQSLDALGF